MPLTMEQYARSLKAPALCEQLNIRDLLDNVAVQLNGSLVAGYELSGLHSHYGSDEERNRTKGLLEACCGRFRSARLIFHRFLPVRPSRIIDNFTPVSGLGIPGPLKRR